MALSRAQVPGQLSLASMTLKTFSVSSVMCMALWACVHDPIIGPIPGNPTDPTDPGSGGTGSTITCSSDSVYFARDIAPMLRSNCAFAGCHGDGSAADGVELSTYDNIIRTGRVRAGRPDNSKLFESVVDNDPGDRMPPAPRNPLSTEQVALLRKWIEQGAPNNSCSSCPEGSPTYAAVVWPIIQRACTGCHSGAVPSAGIQLSDYSSVKASADAGTLARTIRHESGVIAMPYNQPKLPDCEIDAIVAWIDAGSPNN